MLRRQPVLGRDDDRIQLLRDGSADPVAAAEIAERKPPPWK
jgi:hypothetical protein